MESRANGKIVEVEYGREEQVTIALQHEVKAAFRERHPPFLQALL